MGRTRGPTTSTRYSRNLWNDPAYKKLSSELVADLHDHLPAPRPDRLPVSTPV